tara:strand:+ start:9280 stop:10599 length:1320 start_codon:yes stop_codon:yes gene_type:complete
VRDNVRESEGNIVAKPKSPKSGGPTEDEDKVAVDVTPEDQSAEFDKTPPEPESDELVLPEPDAKPDTPIADTPQPDVPQDDDSVADSSVVDSDATEMPAAEDDHAQEPPVEEEPTAPDNDRFVPAVQPQQNSNPFWPLVLGGVVAACLGLVAGKSQVIDPILPQSWRSAGESADTTASIEAMGQTVSQLQAEVDTLRGQIPDAPADNSETLNALNASVEDLVARIDGLEQRPQASSDASSDADVAALTQQMEAQQEQIDKLLEDAQLMQETATAAAGNTLARAAATRVLSAIDSGAPFATALADVDANSDIEIPAELQRVADDGVTPLSELQQTLPDAARAALAAARTNATDADGGFGGFLKRQLGARSVQPREGTDPDAILSRVENATRQGRLADALAEADALPEPAKAELQSWMDAAQARLEAMNAAETLIQRLAAN